MAEGGDWKEQILKALKRRNKKQTRCFVGIIQAQNKLFENAAVLKAQNVQLTVEVERLKEENLTLTLRGDSVGGSEKTQALEQKLYKQQEELTELHRKTGHNAQQIIDLNNALQEKEKELQQRDSKLLDAESNISGLRAAMKNLEKTILELGDTNQVITDEHQALQLAYSALEEKYRKLRGENAELVTRWMDLKAKDADKMNAENDVFVRTQQAKLQRELAEAAREPVIVKPTGSIGIVPLYQAVLVPSNAKCKFDAHEGEVNAVKWSPSGRIFATGGADRKLKLWDIQNGICENKGMLMGSNAGITALEFDYEEHYILGSSNDFASRVWSIVDQRLRHTLTGHSGKVLAAKFLGDSTKVVSGSHDRTLKIWDLHSKACVKTIFAGSSCNDLVTIDSTSVISGHFDRRIRFWDPRVETSSNELSLQGRVTSLDLTPDKLSLLSCTRDDTIKIIDLRMNQVSATFCADGFKVGCDWTRAIFSPDGQYVVSGSQDGSVFIWNVSKNKVEKVLKEHSHAVIACSWNPTGSSIITCEKQRKVILWSDY
ncbi:autophagy-related protein 16-1-like [Liolophura sinensis]|uniref:autophagy-related protein 16-1-like n=1 Tax=Liolophura sinensis TaxID=3198878 RepID=UPI0031589374